MIPAYFRLLKIALLGTCLLPIITTVCSKVLLSDAPASALSLRPYVPTVVASLALLAALWFLLNKSQRAVAAMSREQTRFLDQLPHRVVDLAIFTSAGLSLFLELAVIRVQACEFPIFAFYKNLGLLACFAGLGLGYALSSRHRIPMVLVVPLLAWQLGMLVLLKRAFPPELLSSLKASPVVEQLNMGLAVASTFSHYLAIYLLLAVVFLLTALAFVPLGQLCGRLMERRRKLPAYGLNLLGSVAGVLVILAVSSRWTPPAVWFALALAVLVALQAANRRSLLLAAGFSFATLTLLTWPFSYGAQKLYSPYQLIERTCDDRGLMNLRAAGLYYQQVHDLGLSNANRHHDPELKRIADYYDLPYKLHGDPAAVAVVGAGTGNDVAAALRAGVRSVSAIEIDPVIAKLGRRFHPEKPYADPRTEVFINDARSFLRTTTDKYDLIVYGLLDSHGLLSHASSVRLDSFVYTIEGLREARARLNDDGILCLSFAHMGPEMGRKIYLMLQQAFDGCPPVCIRAGYDGADVFVQATNGPLTVPDHLLAQSGFENITPAYADASLRTDPATDDWPFFYMPRRIYPFSYLGMMLLVIVLAAILNGTFLRQRPRYSQAAFFFLGAGFMLVETKGITELGLAFGNTWQVIGIVIAGILVMAFLANCLVQVLGLSNPHPPFVLLLLSLAGGLLLARSGGLPSTTWGRLATVAVLTCPMFFSGMVFSTMLSSSRGIAGVMALNLLGAMCGGVLEYNAMYFGYRFLYWLAMGLYLLGFACSYLSPAVGRARHGIVKRWPLVAGHAPG